MRGVGIDTINFVTKPINIGLTEISKQLRNILAKNKVKYNQNQIDLSSDFNHCVELLYYTSPNLKINT